MVTFCDYWLPLILLVTKGDIWWPLMIFDDFSWQNYVAYYDMLWHVMKFHYISQTYSQRWFRNFPINPITCIKFLINDMQIRFHSKLEWTCYQNSDNLGWKKQRENERLAFFFFLSFLLYASLLSLSLLSSSFPLRPPPDWRNRGLSVCSFWMRDFSSELNLWAKPFAMKNSCRSNCEHVGRLSASNCKHCWNQTYKLT